MLKKSEFVTIDLDHNRLLSLFFLFSNRNMEADKGATALYSFDPYKFGLFLLAFYIVPYPVYRSIAHRLKWETNPKTMSRHWSDLFDGISYGLILFIFGNYSNTLR